MISIIVPAFNEKKNVSILCKKLEAILGSRTNNYEIIIVDDGSIDDTWSKIQQLSINSPHIQALKLSRNFGHQKALLAGFHAARGKAIITMDADLQHPPELVPILLDYWEKGYKVVNTIRITTENEGFFKKVTSKVFYRIFSWLTGISLKEGMADFRLIDAEVVKNIKKINESHIFIRGLIQWMGFKAAEVSYHAPKRQNGSSKYTWCKMIRFAIVGITAFSVFPLRISIAIGLITSIFAFLELGYILIVSLIFKNAVPGWASIIGLISLLFGILFILLGMIGEYIGRIFEATKKRPMYIIEQHLKPNFVEYKNINNNISETSSFSKHELPDDFTNINSNKNQICKKEFHGRLNKN